MREHAWGGYTDRPGPVVVHEAELVGESVELCRRDRDRGVLCAVVEHGLVDRIGNALATRQWHEEEVVHAAAGDLLVNDRAFDTALVLLCVQDLSVDSLVDDYEGQLHLQLFLREGVLDRAYFLCQYGLELPLTDAVALKHNALWLEAVQLPEALRAAQHTVRDLRAQFLLEVLCLDVARLLAEILVETGGETQDTFACAMPHVDAAHHGGYGRALGLDERPRRSVVELGDHLCEQLTDDAGHALATGECLGKHDLCRDREFRDREPLCEFVEVEVVLLLAARRHDQQHEVDVAQVAHVLQPLLCVARAFLHDWLVHGQVGALAS